MSEFSDFGCTRFCCDSQDKMLKSPGFSPLDLFPIRSVSTNCVHPFSGRSLLAGTFMNRSDCSNVGLLALEAPVAEN